MANILHPPPPPPKPKIIFPDDTNMKDRKEEKWVNMKIRVGSFVTENFIEVKNTREKNSE